MPCAIACSTVVDISCRAFSDAVVTPELAPVPAFGRVRHAWPATFGGAVPGRNWEYCGADFRLVLRNHSSLAPVCRPSSSVSPTQTKALLAKLSLGARGRLRSWRALR